jgi:hypothetical protein
MPLKRSLLLGRGGISLFYHGVLHEDLGHLVRLTNRGRLGDQPGLQRLGENIIHTLLREKPWVDWFFYLLKKCMLTEADLGNDYIMRKR